jgi:hypothetical protein
MVAFLLGVNLIFGGGGRDDNNFDFTVDPLLDG